MKKVLFFDATNSWILVGCYLLQEDNRIASVNKYEALHNRESSTLLVQEIIRSMKEAEWEKPDILVTALGPGSFTGVRISVSTARNFSQIWNVPVLGYDSLDIYSSHYFSESETPVTVSIEAKQKKIFFGLRDKRGYCGSFDLLPDQIGEILPQDRLGSYITGVKYTDSVDFFPGENMRENLPSPAAILSEKATEIRRALSSPEEHSHLSIVPNYVRGTYADDKPKVYYT